MVTYSSLKGLGYTAPDLSSVTNLIPNTNTPTPNPVTNPSPLTMPIGSKLGGGTINMQIASPYTPSTQTTPIIPATTLTQKENPIPVPPPVVNNSANGIISGLVSNNPVTNNVTNTSNASTQTTQATPQIDYGKQILDLLNQDNTPVSTADQYAQAQKDAGIVEKQQAVNDYTAQLNQIGAELKANQLKQGDRLASMGEISGTQGKLERDAAIRALPISASLNAAQGNLQAAQSNMETLFKLKSEDVTNAYNAKKDQRNAVLGYLSDAEKAQVLAQQRTDDRAFEVSKININEQNNWASEAIKNGQSNLASAITKLDPNSKTFNSDLANLQKQFITQTASEPPLIKSINGIDMQWNASMQKWEPIVSGVVGGNEQAQKSVDNLTWLMDTAKQASDLSTAAGRSGIRKGVEGLFVGSTKYTQLEQLTDSLKTNVLSLMTDPNIKKFFGPQMSEADVRIMSAAGTTLNPEKLNPDQMKTEITRLSDLFNRMQTAVKEGMTGGSGYDITAPDGTIVHISG